MAAGWEAVEAECIISAQRRKGGLWLVGLVGVPGSGKTASAQLLAREVRKQVPCEVLPMDGFHYYRRELDQFPDPQLAHFRRGAHFTFNAESLLRKLQTLQSGQLTLFPSFSHSTGDPVEDSISIDPTHTSVVIIEGLYLFLEVDHWLEIRSLLDYRLFLEASLDDAMERTFTRNARCLPYPPEVVRERIEKNDRVNGELVESTKQFADTVVQFYPKSAEQLAGLE